MIVIPISSALYQEIHTLAQERRMVFMTGLPGVGKSLLIQQLALIAHGVGRRVHILQYNDARQPFETADLLARYPEIEGVTDPMIRKGVGLWSRQAIVAWAAAYADPEHILIGELPLIGNRLIELVEVLDDPAEPLLAGPQSQFVIPIPSWEVREVIEETRAQTIADPRNELEKLDAPPNVLQALWQEVNLLARQAGLTKARPDSPYNPYIYGGVYELLLRNRPALPLMIDQVLRPQRSVYELEIHIERLRPTESAAAAIIQKVEEQYLPAELKNQVENWHTLITEEPIAPDSGPELRLPMPEQLFDVVEQTTLLTAEKSALKRVLDLPLNAPIEEVLPVLEDALDTLRPQLPDAQVKADVHKFDVYDSYFNVVRSDEENGRVFLAGLLQSYHHVLENLLVPPESLTVVELPLLRMALETTLRLFVDERE